MTDRPRKRRKTNQARKSQKLEPSKPTLQKDRKRINDINILYPRCKFNIYRINDVKNFKQEICLKPCSDNKLKLITL